MPTWFSSRGSSLVVLGLAVAALTAWWTSSQGVDTSRQLPVRPPNEPHEIEAVVLDVKGDGVVLCAAGPTVRLSPDHRSWVPRKWTCPDSDDAILTLPNPGRDVSPGDMLGMKIGPANGFDFLRQFGGRGRPRGATIGPGEEWFNYLALWTDANHNGMMDSIDELAGFQYMGFESVVLPASRVREASGVTRRGSAIRNGAVHEMVSFQLGTR